MGQRSGTESTAALPYFSFGVHDWDGCFAAPKFLSGFTDLQPVPLMHMDFLVGGQLVRLRMPLIRY